jgi:cytochrome P450
METLRLEQSEFIVRDVLEDIRVNEFVVPAGWHLRVCVRESHQDPAAFPDPQRFDPDRFIARFNRHQYSPFGALAHTCLGVKTTHVIASSFVRQLAIDYDLAITGDGAHDFNQHWRPSRHHRVVLRRNGSLSTVGA